MVLINFAVCRPWLEWILCLHEVALFSLLWETEVTCVNVWEVLEAFLGSFGEWAVFLQLAGVDALSISGNLISVAIVVIFKDSAVLGPWGNGKSGVLPEVALWTDSVIERESLVMESWQFELSLHWSNLGVNLHHGGEAEKQAPK